MAGSGIAVHGVAVDAVACLIATVPEEAPFATFLTERASEASRTRARACAVLYKTYTHIIEITRGSVRVTPGVQSAKATEIPR